MPEELVPRFMQALAERRLGWEELLHADAEFSLLAFEGRTIRGRNAIARALNASLALWYRPRVVSTELLDQRTVLVEGVARFPKGRGIAESRAYWLEEVLDGLVWRVRGFTSEAAARKAYADSLP